MFMICLRNAIFIFYVHYHIVELPVYVRTVKNSASDKKGQHSAPDKKGY